MIADSTVPLHAASTSSDTGIEPSPGCARHCFQRLVTALSDCFHRRAGLSDISGGQVIASPDTSLNQRIVSHSDDLPQALVLLRQAESLTMFTAERLFPDSLFPDPSEPDTNAELSQPSDNPSKAKSLAEKLLLAWQNTHPIITNAHYGNVGRFCHLRPGPDGKLFARNCSTLLSLYFAEAGEALRQEAMGHFTRLCHAGMQHSAGQNPGNLHTTDQFTQQVFSDFVKGVHRSVNLEQAFKKWEHDGLSGAQLPKSDTSLHRLMIEGRLCKNASERFILDNEAGYLERCYRSFMYLLNILANSPGKKLSMGDINQVAAIVGASLSSRNVQYGLTFDKAENHPCFIEMMKENPIFNKSRLSHVEVKNRLAPLLNGHLFLSGHMLYSNKKVLQKKLGNSYFNISLKAADDHYMHFYIEYWTRNKQKDGQKIIDDYYNKVATKTDQLDIIETAVDACCQLQRRHLFDDGNGRVLLFALLPILLYQQGIWLKEGLNAPWSTVDSIPPRAIAEQLLPQCEKRPVFTAPLDWQAGMPEAERVRLLCAMGETEALIDTIHHRPEWLMHTFRPTNQTLLSIAATNSRMDIVEHILDCYPESVEPNALAGLLRHLEYHSYDKKLIRSIRRFHDQHVINKTH